MKKLLAFAAAALLLTGCQLKTATYADDQAIPLEEGQTDSLIMSVSLEYPVKGAPEEVIEKISHSILTTAFDLEEEPGEVIETARRYEDNLKDGYFNEYEDVTSRTDTSTSMKTSRKSASAPGKTASTATSPANTARSSPTWSNTTASAAARTVSPR